MFYYATIQVHGLLIHIFLGDIIYKQEGNMSTISLLNKPLMKS